MRATHVDLDSWHMQRALRLAAQGQGRVEPNPLVGCIVARGAEAIGEGWHQRFGGPHAEIEALAVAGRRAQGGTLYVTLEPCCHQGKTPPCTQAILNAGVRRVVAAMIDPFPAVAGGGLRALQAAGVEVHSGVLAAESAALNAPYLKRLARGRPWVIAKWAMTLDGKLATSTGESQWISGPASRAQVHALRGRVDGILVGIGTALSDDPLLTARPPGLRTALRIVVDSQARLPLQSQLVRTAAAAPVLVAVGPAAPNDRCDALNSAGCGVWRGTAEDPAERLAELLDELGRRNVTNLLVEGGGQILGSLLAISELDEAHVYVAPRLVGGTNAPSPVGGPGIARLAAALRLEALQAEQLGDDWHLWGRIARSDSSATSNA